MKETMDVKTYPLFDINKLVIEKPTTTKTGNMYFNIVNDSVLQTPTCKLVYKPEYSVTIHVKTHDFEDFLYKLDEKVIDTISKFTGKDKEELLDIYKPFLNCHGKYDDALSFMRININNRTKSSEGTKFFDNETPIEKDETIHNLKVGDEVKCLIGFKKVQLKQKNDDWVLSVQTELLQVKIISRVLDKYQISNN